MKKLSIILLGFIFVAPSAFAQTTNEMRAMVTRLDQLENQVQSLGQSNGTPIQPTARYQSPTTSAVSSLEIRLSSLEEQMRQLNGQIEKQNFDISQLKTQADKSRADMEMRLSALEQKGAAAPVAATPPSASNNVPVEDNGEHALVANNKPAGDNTNSNSDQDYDAAYDKMQKKDYAGADADFRAFLKKYPGSSLASNAQYWLGESLYARKQYAEALPVFAEGYKKYPKGNKAPDTLLKMGVTFGDLKKNTEACTVFRQLAKDFPSASGAIATRAETEMRKLKCS